MGLARAVSRRTPAVGTSCAATLRGTASGAATIARARRWVGLIPDLQKGFRSMKLFPGREDPPEAPSYGVGLITSNAVEGTRASVASSSSLQRGSGAPLTNHPEPLSAT